MISFTQEEWDSYQQSLNFLECLEEAGVDNWSGYEMAQELMEKYECK